MQFRSPLWLTHFNFVAILSLDPEVRARVPNGRRERCFQTRHRRLFSTSLSQWYTHVESSSIQCHLRPWCFLSKCRPQIYHPARSYDQVRHSPAVPQGSTFEPALRAPPTLVRTAQSLPLGQTVLCLNWVPICPDRWKYLIVVEILHMFVYGITIQSRTWEVLDWGEYFSDVWAVMTHKGSRTDIHYVQ